MRRGWLWLLLLVAASVSLGLWLAVPHLVACHHWRAAQAAMDRYHSAEALDHLHACLEAWPGSARAHLLACRSARRLGNLAEAKEHLYDCQRLEDKASPECELEVALLGAASGDLETVESYLETWLRDHPAEAPLAWEALAEGYLRVYRVPDALRCLDLWLRRQPDNPQALFLRAKVARQLGSPRRALPDYRRVVEIDSERAEARRLLALCLLELGQLNEAAAELEILRRHQPDDPELLAGLARCQGKLGRFGPARQTLARALSRDPKYGPALRTRGLLALWEKQPADAEVWLRRTLEALPHDYEAHFVLSQALQQQGKTAAAEAQARIAENLKRRLERLDEIKRSFMAQHPRDPEAHYELGTLLLSLGHTEVGRDWLLSALRLDPDYRPAHAALAEYFAAANDIEQAEAHRARALGDTPKSPRP
jgi:tetratricopeptide (TPR) repeat protein